ncbi:MAG TPA: phosphopantothenoylcysteine decarboxylase [Sedimentisphaerales bacterium]|nr:phosphopantothenoylcysteine decarboxylase [Sedimentisphaerales bacterium]
MRFLITAGGTREYLDPVRFISNASSGKMGFALARAALRAGHKVTLIAAPTTERPPSGGKIIKVESAAEMFAAVRKHFARCDCLIMAAAVSDYTPARQAKSKIKRAGKSLTLRLKPTADILRWAGAHKRIESKPAKGKRQIVVGFALEDKNLRERAEQKLREKNLDMIIANSVAAIGAEKSTVEIKGRGSEWVSAKNASKDAIAKRIISLVEGLSE